MTDGIKRAQTDFTNETVISTPEPKACSTVQRPQTSKLLDLRKIIPMSYVDEADSLGILSLDSLSVNFPKCNENQSFVTKKLMQQRDLASSILERSNKQLLPSKYLKPSESLYSDLSVNNGCESTVNESDLIRTKHLEKLSFVPNDISTPRSSCASDEGGSPRMSVEGFSHSLSQDLELFAYKLKNSNVDLSDLCEEFNNFDHVEGESFASGELAAAKLDQYEKSWRKQRDALGGNSIKGDSLFSQFENSNFTANEGISVTDFFRKKSELADLFLKKSPEKESAPTPLIDKSVTFETVNESDFGQSISSNNSSISIKLPSESNIGKSNPVSFMENMRLSNEFGNSSILSISDIEKICSENDTTTKLMDCMFGKKQNNVERTKESAGLQQKKYSFTYSQDKNLKDFKENQHPYKDSLVDYKPEKLIKSPNKLKEKYEKNKLSNLQTSCSDSCNASVKPLKESQNNNLDKSAGSLRTISSLDSLPGGKLPLETNRIELVWGCIPVGTKKTQTFILRNRSQNKLKMQLTSSNSNFKILDRTQADSVQNLTVALHPSESRSFSITFAPTTIGAMAERISFSPIGAELQAKQTTRQQLNLFGYGGCAQVEILDVPKDVNLKMWLSLGKLANLPELEKKFLVRNTGSLTAFAYLSFGSKALFGYAKTVHVTPTEVVLRPKEEKSIKVTYTPTKGELTHLLAISKNQVIEIGYIQVITGAEPLRGRIRRLCKKLKNEAGTIGNPLIEKLSRIFPDEKMPSDIKKLTETVGSVKELMQDITSKEIIVTLERSMEESIGEHMIGIEETTMFHSLAEGQQTAFFNATLTNSTCMVEPTNIVLMLPSKTNDNVLVINQTNQSLQFQTTLTNNEVLQVKPSEGILPPGETMLMKITCDIQKFKKQQQQTFKLSIYVDDDVYDVDIKIILIKPRSY